MDIEKMRQVREQIIEAIKEFQSNGGILVTNYYGVTWDPELHQWKTTESHCACALSCVLLKKQPNPGITSDPLMRALNKALEVEFKFIEGFIAGYDNKRVANLDPEAYILGQEIAQMFNPIHADDFNSPGPEEDEEDYDYGRDPEPTDDYGLN